jgi:hypothetical protein
MIAALRRLSLMNRLSLTAGPGLAGHAADRLGEPRSLHGLLYSDRQVKTRHLVETVVGVLEHYHDAAEGGHADRRRSPKQQAIGRSSGCATKRPSTSGSTTSASRCRDGDASDGARTRRQGARRSPLQQGDLAAGRQSSGDKLRESTERTCSSASTRWSKRPGEGYVEYLWPKATRRRRRQQRTVHQAVLRQEVRTLGLGRRFRHLH